ncbi:hypothetical protein BXZ70DRAFT_962644 [Cristinia sonorae]|uniref:Sacsin/Nov domain-containing protein n=1 Tax=Cristinia sonorae TaxID=1940300 RepID=A0A8K0UEL7_9AGAR|nr:hypothetical protein BXZ70DRAFT_962644 [Cristinia sonorae]
MDLVETIRREELGFIDVKGQPKVAVAFQRLRDNLARALSSLSDELYSKASHFLLEFIQNADDNSYPEGVAPTLKIRLEPGWLIIQSNELGFTEENVKALCKIGASTKKNKEGYIGEKGIGFKSVFRITDVVYVLSREYSFYFDRTRELGMIAPIWSTQYPVQKGWTTFRLKLSSDASFITSHISHIQPSLLLFLRKLREIDVTLDDKKLGCRRTEMGSDIILTSVDGSTSESQRYLVSKHKVPAQTDDPRRHGIRESEIILAFPLTMDEEPIIRDQAVYAFLPLRNFGFKFIIQGDFLTPSSREDILSDLPWNITLRNGIPSAFIQAIEEFKRRPNLCFRWLRFIPDGISDTFMQPVQDKLLDDLKEQPIILCSDDVYRKPSEVLMEPFCGTDGQPLINPQFLEGLFYISSRYDLASDKTRLNELGVEAMTRDHFLRGVGNVCATGSNLDRQDNAWHESICTLLLEIWDAESSNHWQMKSLRIIPHTDNTWCSSWLTAHFSSPNHDIPPDLGLYYVRPIEPQSARYRMYQKLGVTEASPISIAKRILEIHANADESIQRSNILAHVRYLFEHRHELETVFSGGVSLWVKTNDNSVAKAGDLYMDHPRYEEFSLSEFLSAPFIAAEYMGQYPADSKDFKIWCDWLRDQLGIQTTPRITPESLSPEFSKILQSVKTAQLLRFLRQYWPDVRERIINSPQALAELRNSQVTCIDGSTERLESTFLETRRLRQYTDLPFLPVVNPDDEGWLFLEHLGVSMKLDGSYSLKRLMRLSQNPGVRKEEVEELYKQLETHFQEGDNTRQIRDAFKTHKLIFAKDGNPKSKGSWRGLSEVVWVAFFSVQSKCSLDWQYSHLKNFFLAVGVDADCPPDILADEIRPIAAEWKGKTLTDEIYQRVSDILRDINRVLFWASERAQQIDLGWLYALRNEAIFTVNSPDLGVTLLSASDTFYIPDRTGHLASLFAKDVAILVPPLLAKQQTAKNFTWYAQIIKHSYFKKRILSLDAAVTSQTNTIGDRVRDDALSEEYTKRVPLLRRLIHNLPLERQSRIRLRYMSVYRVTAVETKFTVNDKTQSVAEEVALELNRHRDGDNLVIIIGDSCHAAHRDTLLSNKIAVVLQLEPTAVLLALTTNPLEQAEAMFTKLNIACYDEEDNPEYDEDRAESLPFTFGQRNKETDFKEVFGSAESQLKAAGFRASLSQASKYQLNYNKGALGVTEGQQATFKPATSTAAPINIPSNGPKYPAPNNTDTEYQIPDEDPSILETFGEFFVFEGLRSNLPGFGVNNWTSILRGRIPEFEPFRGTGRAAFTYKDDQGKLTEFLYGSATREEWAPDWPTYYLDVKTSQSSMGDNFTLSRNQCIIAAELTIANPHVAPKEVYALVRVADIKQSTRSFRILPDPHRLLYDQQIKLVGYNTYLSVVL